MKVIFLDFDGVLNGETEVCAHGVTLLPAKLLLLKQIVEQTRAKIVLSTSWRDHWSADPRQCDPTGRQINGMFRQYGLEIRDKTPRLHTRREAEIKGWLDAHPETQSFVVLDDALLGGDFLRGHFVKTSGYFGGLDASDVQKAVAILNGGGKE